MVAEVVTRNLGSTRGETNTTVTAEVAVHTLQVHLLPHQPAPMEIAEEVTAVNLTGLVKVMRIKGTKCTVVSPGIILAVMETMETAMEDVETVKVLEVIVETVILTKETVKVLIVPAKDVTGLEEIVTLVKVAAKTIIIVVHLVDVTVTVVILLKVL